MDVNIGQIAFISILNCRLNHFQQAAHCRKQEQREFGVFYDDDYDYMQHLKDVNELYQVEPIESYRVREGSASDKVRNTALASTELKCNFMKYYQSKVCVLSILQFLICMFFISYRVTS